MGHLFRDIEPHDENESVNEYINKKITSYFKEAFLSRLSVAFNVAFDKNDFLIVTYVRSICNIKINISDITFINIQLEFIAILFDP